MTIFGMFSPGGALIVLALMGVIATYAAYQEGIRRGRSEASKGRVLRLSRNFYGGDNTFTMHDFPADKRRVAR